MKTRSVLIPTIWHTGLHYDIRSDSMAWGRWRFCVRIRSGWPVIRWGWRFEFRGKGAR